jgi:hypothetical protein
MANEFIIKNGFHSNGNSEITGSFNVTGSIVASGPITGSFFTGSFVGDGVSLTNISGSSLYDNVRTVAFELGVSSTEAITTGAKGRKTIPYLGTSTTLTGWTTSVSPDDVFLLYVDSNDAATYISLELDILLT